MEENGRWWVKRDGPPNLKVAFGSQLCPVVFEICWSSLEISQEITRAIHLQVDTAQEREQMLFKRVAYNRPFNMFRWCILYTFAGIGSVLYRRIQLESGFEDIDEPTISAFRGWLSHARFEPPDEIFSDGPPPSIPASSTSLFNGQLAHWILRRVNNHRRTTLPRVSGSATLVALSQVKPAN
ncbi:conserved hypothetical protein [Coccidioides posadasii str. Silveira]|uniref:Uncharacterized protein n=1 Tax=Coccidioides posadasii (strain RMSCC 757 / Silveira) TaxID=443226 RepID=E9CYV3_COCPS|nr:conserved hypothetical protein [Coccidioides posadasii str. Silveira]